MWIALSRRSLIALVVSACVSPASTATAQQVLPAPTRSNPVPAESSPRSAKPNASSAVSPSASIWQLPAPRADNTLDRLHHPILRQDLRINGAVSCATANCHAGPRPGVLDPTASRAMEYQVWKEQDPHSRSWRTISGQESVDMMQRLGILRDGKIVDAQGFDNCLACHNSIKRFDEPRWQPSQHASSVNSFLREGVGCAACHGPSEHWINTHYQRSWTPTGAAEEGFVEASDLYVRARMCASCHVGDRDRDMNHDLIAAGHPSLRYEFATFHAWQPKHWRDAETSDKTRFEAQLWLAGQVAATDASLALLQTRSEQAHTVSQWPEFAAYDCASCHHNLGLDNRRDPLSERQRSTANYSQWNDAGLRWLLNYRIENEQAVAADRQLKKALERVEQQMERRPRPQADQVAAAAAAARRALAKWFDSDAGQQERARFGSDRLGRVVAGAAGKPETYGSWESAVQFYLASVAARESWPQGWNGPVRETADRLQIGLRYPEMIDISRYARRADARGPTLSITETMTLGIDLAQHLGPVRIEADDFDEPLDGVQTQNEIRKQLKELQQQALQRRRQQDEAKETAPKTDKIPDDSQPDRKQPDRKQPDPKEPADEPKRQSIEELRKSLEALQSDRSAEGDRP